MELARETTPENFLDTRCNVGASKNAVTHFLRGDYLYIWYLKSFRGSVRWQPVKRILGGFLFQILGGRKGEGSEDFIFLSLALLYSIFQIGTIVY